MMKKLLTIFAVLILSIGTLAACSDKDKENNDEGKSEEQSGESNDTNQDNEDANADDENEEAENADDEESKPGEIDGEDQLDLVLGDTGHFDTTLGTYDMTVSAAELKGYDFEGIESQLDDWILLDVTIKNTSDKALNAEDVIGAMEVTDNLEGSGSIGAVGAFDAVKDFEGEIEPGEEQSAQFITEVFEADAYYFRKVSGNVAGGSSNQVIWNIKSEDLK
ncbi:hypothetical protein DX933_11885 [Ornithinibacillus gellani]|nr:hypothetical protein DX933_11885 [Ornithinibacillus gellani]